MDFGSRRRVAMNREGRRGAGLAGAAVTRPSAVRRSRGPAPGRSRTEPEGPARMTGVAPRVRRTVGRGAATHRDPMRSAVDPARPARDRNCRSARLPVLAPRRREAFRRPPLVSGSRYRCDEVHVDQSHAPAAGQHRDAVVDRTTTGESTPRFRVSCLACPARRASGRAAPMSPSDRPRRRCGCRCATRSGGRQAARSALPAR
jgi:hypothetical protein